MEPMSFISKNIRKKIPTSGMALIVVLAFCYFWRFVSLMVIRVL